MGIKYAPTCTAILIGRVLGLGRAVSGGHFVVTYAVLLEVSRYWFQGTGVVGTRCFRRLFPAVSSFGHHIRHR